MTIYRVTDTGTRETIGKAITALRAEQLRAVIPSSAEEIGQRIDLLLEEWAAAVA